MPEPFMGVPQYYVNGGWGIVAGTVWIAPRAMANQRSQARSKPILPSCHLGRLDAGVIHSARTLVSGSLPRPATLTVDFGRWIPRGLPGSRALSSAPGACQGWQGRSGPFDCSNFATPAAVSCLARIGPFPRWKPDTRLGRLLPRSKTLPIKRRSLVPADIDTNGLAVAASLSRARAEITQLCMPCPARSPLAPLRSSHRQPSAPGNFRSEFPFSAASPPCRIHPFIFYFLCIYDVLCGQDSG